MSRHSEMVVVAGKSASMPRNPAPLGAYRDGKEHLEHELQRIHALVQAFTLRWEDLVLGGAAVDAEGVQRELRRFRSSPFRWDDRPIHADFQRAIDDCILSANRLQDEIDARRTATPDSIRLPLRDLSAAFGLSADEQVGRGATLLQDILLIALLAERSPPHRMLFGLVQEYDGRRSIWPTVETCLRILTPDCPADRLPWSAFASESPLVANGLIALHDNPDGDFPRRGVRLDARIADHLFGVDELDVRLLDIARVVMVDDEGRGLHLNESEQQRWHRLADWRRIQRPGNSLVMLLHGPYGTPKLAAASAFCAEVGTHELLVMNAAAALRREDWAETLRLCRREAKLRGCAIYWQGAEAILSGHEDRWLSLMRQAEDLGLVTFLDSTTGWEPVDQFRNPARPFLRLDFAPPSRLQRQQAWAERLLSLGHRHLDSDAIDMLASAFQFTEGQIEDALATAHGLALTRDTSDERGWWECLYEACRRQSARRLVTFAQRIEPRVGARLDELVLPESNRRQMEELFRRIALRDYVYRDLGFEERLSLGHGLVVLFTGASGTGKTMAASLLAAAQRVDLYKVDLAAVVSKYVGETEKNLGRLFSEAQDANAILFFDEADAIFGKRGEVEDARDRWANLEVNYLLQRVEEYKGTVILATNLRQNIDDAFMRRIHVLVDFPFPDARARLRILQGCFARGVQPPGEDELGDIAQRFPLSGGSIKNVVLDAAFRMPPAPRHERPAITTRHLVAAVAREYQKLGKPVTPGEFGPRYFDWVQEDLLFGREHGR